jgi:methylmalonyl-CoA mutase
MHQFPDVSRETWQSKALAAAKGKAFDADLALQGRLDGPRAWRGAHGPWKVFQRLDDGVVARALAQAKEELAQGADGLILATLAAAPVLDELPLHSFALRNEAGDDGADAIFKAVSRQPVDPERLAVDFGLVQPGYHARLQAQGFRGPFMRGDGRPWHQAGCNDAQELGAALAQAIASLRALDGLADQALASAVSLTLAASQDMFGTIAKFRAARILWAEILAGCGLPQRPLALHGETSLLMMADVDAHSNILRVSAALFAAGLGGADSLCALPCSAAQGLPNKFARRVARNAQLLLLHEAQLWRVDDPAAGAGALEQRTQSICDEAWAVMQACERGQWPSADPASARALPVIGVSRYPNPKAETPEVEAET